MRPLVLGASLLAALVFALPAWAEQRCAPTPPPTSGGALVTWGAPSAPRAAGSRELAPVAHARELLERARFLDEAATADERASAELDARLPALRASAATARERADRAPEGDRDVLAARAEDLEADVVVSEVEVISRRRSAAESRRVARELRARAVKLAREAPLDAKIATYACDPPYRFSPDGRKVYRIECFR